MKASKDELESLKLEVGGHLQTIAQKVVDKDKYLTACLEESESKFSEKLQDLRQKVNSRLEDQSNLKARELMQRVVTLSE